MIPQRSVPSPDSLRVVLDDVFQGSAYAWETSRGIGDVLWRAFWEVVRWIVRLEDTHPVVYWALVIGGVLVVAAVMAHAIVLVVRTMRKPSATSTGTITRTALARDAEWHRRQAATLAAGGRFLDAMGHMFAALVLELDRRKALRYHPSKTPAEYLREVDVAPERREQLRQLVDDLYAALFGGRVPQAEDWADFAGRVRAFVESHAA